MMRKILPLLAMIGLIGALSACNTMEGMGKDVQRGGEGMEDTAKEVKKSM